VLCETNRWFFGFTWISLSIVDHWSVQLSIKKSNSKLPRVRNLSFSCNWDEKRMWHGQQQRQSWKMQ